jgi:hypothetical protein
VTAPEFAAVTAVAGSGANPGVSVTERLAVLVGVTPSASAGSHSRGGGSHARTIAVVIASVLLLALLALLAARLMLRRGR